MITVVDYTNNGKKANRRPDVLLYVNGIRKLLIEGMTTEIDDTLCRGDEWERIAVYVKLRTLDLNGDFICHSVLATGDKNNYKRFSQYVNT